MRKKLLLLLVFFIRITSANSDSLTIQSVDTTYNSKLTVLENKIDSITRYSYRLNKKLDEINSYENTSNVVLSILISFFVGIFASILVLICDRLHQERSLQKKFKFIEGDYIHLEDNVIAQGANTNIVYQKGGGLILTTTTARGGWEGIILMNKYVRNYGAGSFFYNNLQEGGVLHIILRDENHIYVFPSTLTHKEQRVDFYIMERNLSKKQ